jgi:hypothetical protein
MGAMALLVWGKAVVAVLAVGLLAGCSNRPPTTWSKAGASPDSLRADYSECRRVAQRDSRLRAAYLGPYGGYPAPVRLIESYTMAYRPTAADTMYLSRRLTTACMQNRGYTLAEEPAASTSPRQ